MADPNALLDLDPGIGQVAFTFRWDLLIGGEVAGEVHPAIKPSAPSLRLDTTANIMRTVAPFDLPASELAAVNTLRDEVAGFMVLEDGTEWPIGVFRFASSVTPIASVGLPSANRLVDRTGLIDVPLVRAFSVGEDQSVAAAIRSLISEARISGATVEDPSGVTNPDPQVWQPGTSRKAVIDALCRIGGLLPSYFDRSGVLTIRPPSQLTPADFTLGQPDHYHVYRVDNSRIILGTGQDDARLLDAPNGHQVIGTGPSGADVSAIVYVDAGAPHSLENTGVERVISHHVQSVDSPSAARRVATSYAATDPLDFREARFSSSPDPRHDAFDLVELDGVVYREVRFTLALSDAPVMTHDLNRAGLS